MKRASSLAALIVPFALAVACDDFASDATKTDADAGGGPIEAGPLGSDARPEGGGVEKPCSSNDPFMNVELLRELNTAEQIEDHPSLTPDELTIYFQRAATPTTDGQLFTATRASRGDPFGEPHTVDGLGTFALTHYLAAPAISSDGTRLAFAAFDVTDGTLHTLLYTVDRVAGSSAFGTPAEAKDLNTASTNSFAPNFQADGVRLFFSSDRFDARAELYVAATIDDFHGPHRVTDVTDAGVAGLYPVPNAEATALYWARVDQNGYYRMYVGDLSADGLVVAALRPIMTPSGASFGGAMKSERPGWISPDGCRLYFSQASLGANDGELWVASRR